ncbi:MAG: 50S ribosomal protein L19e [Candidatus Woesearchaeota archaeon]
MKLKVQKRLASSILKRSKKKISIDNTKLEDVKEAITRFDIKTLINDGTIKVKPVKGPSKVRTRKLKEQKKKGRRKGQGSRKGKATARLSKKETWMIKIRNQREFLKELKDKKLIENKIYRDLYNKTKGGYFRSKRHIKLYIDEHSLVKKTDKSKE